MNLQYWNLDTPRHKIWPIKYAGMQRNNSHWLENSHYLYLVIFRKPSTIPPIVANPQITLPVYLKTTFIFVVFAEQLLLKSPIPLKTLQLLLKRPLSNKSCGTRSQFMQNTQTIHQIVLFNSPHLNLPTDTSVFTIYDANIYNMSIPSVVGSRSFPSLFASASFPVLSNTSAKLSKELFWYVP